MEGGRGAAAVGVEGEVEAAGAGALLPSTREEEEAGEAVASHRTSYGGVRQQHTTSSSQDREAVASSTRSARADRSLDATRRWWCWSRW